MSKKRKTRKQKEHAVSRHSFHISNTPEAKTSYSVTGLELKKVEKKPENINPTNSSLADLRYLRKDITSISAAMGIVLAFNILLFVLLSTGVLKLNFLGY